MSICEVTITSRRVQEVLPVEAGAGAFCYSRGGNEVAAWTKDGLQIELANETKRVVLPLIDLSGRSIGSTCLQPAVGRFFLISSLRSIFRI